MRARTRATRSPADSRHVLGYIARLSWMRQLALVALVLVGVACSLAPIQLFRTILDRAIPSRDLVLVAKLAAGLALVTTLGAVATYWRNLMSDRIRQTFLAEFRGSLFAHLLRASPDFFSRQSLGELMNKAQLDVGRLAMTVTAILVDPIVSGATLLIYVGYLLTLSPALTALALASLPVLALAVPALNRRLAANARHFTREIGAFAGAMSESFAGIFEIQVHATYGYTEARVARGEDTVGDVRRDEARLGGWLQALSDLARGAGPILVYGYGAVLAIRGSMQVGEIVAFASTLGGLYGALDKLIKYPPLVTNAQDRFRELLELFRTPCVFLDDGEVVPADGTISLSRVAFAYDERSPVLRDVSLEVPRGEHVALVGRSGCGKSSVLGLIAGRLRPGRGNVRLGGLEIGELAAGEVARAFGVVGQTPFLFNGTLRDNLLYGLLRERDGDVGEARSFLDLAALGLGARPSPDAIDARLVAVCEEVSLRDDLYELGLAAFVAPRGPLGCSRSAAGSATCSVTTPRSSTSIPTVTSRLPRSARTSRSRRASTPRRPARARPRSGSAPSRRVASVWWRSSRGSDMATRSPTSTSCAASVSATPPSSPSWARTRPRSGSGCGSSTPSRAARSIRAPWAAS
ncbi:MAG: ATP-binding cassette domain-containing protein [Deltaproteobacteria bacterium]|nr:ATP-binding cassette domain-containing protein [Deltaproteobacteria bacterium]